MDIRKIKKLIELLEESSLTEIEIVEGEESVRLARGGHAPVMPFAAPQMAAPVPVAAAPVVEPAKDDEDQVPEGELVLSPMVGTFFAASGPGAEAFVSLGQAVGVGDTLCIIEAMKMMNEIKSDLSGKVVSIDIEDGNPVEFGQRIITLN